MAANGSSKTTEVTYEDLMALEYEFDEADLEISKLFPPLPATM